MRDLLFGTPSNQAYTLIELPTEILALLEDASNDVKLEIKGQATDETMLCTPTASYAVRAVQSSNSLLLCSASGGPDGKAEVIASLKQTLDVTPCRPRLDRIDDLLAENTWIHDDEEPVKVSKRLRRHTLEDLYELVQANTTQIDAYLQQKRVLSIDGYLRPVALSSQLYLLSTLLRVQQDLDSKADLPALQKEFGEDADIIPDLANQILAWFPPLQDKAFIDIPGVVKEVGKLLLQTWWGTKGRKESQVVGGSSIIPLKDFMLEWSTSVGEKCEGLCELSLLQGNYILTGSDALLSVPAKNLPLEPAARFTRLFSLQSRWKPEDMKHFLTDIAVNDKEREKWVLKSVRKVKEGKEVLYVAR